MIKLKTPEEIEKIAVSGKILSVILKILAENAVIGAKLKELDELARRLVVQTEKRLGVSVRPAFLGYRSEGSSKSYPAAICASVNDTIVHGYPSDYRLKSGDILKLDFGINYDGYYSDAAITVGIGEISPQARKLIEVTKGALEKAIKRIKPGRHLGDIGWAISEHVKSAGKGKFKVIEGLTGHGVGLKLHEEPTVYNYGSKGDGEKLEKGMVLAIEPMVSAGSEKIIQKDDDSYAASDGSLSAHFEHTVVVTDSGAKILT
ncbi:type I methionyl aminopeptidase [Candidatus Wolfebacteria bacterium]|nr:type I methionyl aminopeptidase [Candidatus Wolfebacteria bacterium]